MEDTYGNYLEIVSRPGKFQGESPYVPYLWEQYAHWDGGTDIGSVASVEITEDDVFHFPELEGLEFVYLHESADGLVSEITHREYQRQLVRIEEFLDSQIDDECWGGDDDSEEDSDE